MILVSSCLIGNKCRYDGSDNYHQGVIDFIGDRPYISVCPEELGGLATPREPAEICEKGVITKSGLDVTKAFEVGADLTRQIALEHRVQTAVMKAKSPSCGCGLIYDGNHCGKLISGDGLTTKALRELKIKIITELDL